MKVHLCAVGRLKGPNAERALVDDYVDRFNLAGRSMGWGPLKETEVEDRKGGGMAAEAVLLQRAVPKGAIMVVMDERGVVMGSPEFARQLQSWADLGRDVAFLIGGADGIDPELRQSADFSLSFGKMVWPHKLVRVMLAEQLYRAASIQMGSPYHRS